MWRLGKQVAHGVKCNIAATRIGSYNSHPEENDEFWPPLPTTFNVAQRYLQHFSCLQKASKSALLESYSKGPAPAVEWKYHKSIDNLPRAVKQQVHSESLVNLANLTLTLPSATNEKKTQSSEQNERDDLHQLVASIANDLQFGNNLLTAEFENQAGVELANISENEQNSYDFLIGKKKRKTTRKSYKKEAFLCFRESRKLGSTKGTFNLGLCYEQGLGTRVDLAKAARCYEDAAEKGHTLAKYNLSLLHYYSKLINSDQEKSMSLMRQAAGQGLQQAWVALVHMVSTQYANACSQSVLRKTQSEPRHLGGSHRDGVQVLAPERATFYIGDYN